MESYGDLQKGLDWPSPRFTVGTGAKAGCITDNLTGLIWERNADNLDRTTWNGALTYANDLVLGGYGDWRLPNRKELRSLVNYEEPHTYEWLNLQGFNNVQGDYWSSTVHADTGWYAWRVWMDIGQTYGVEMDDPTIPAWAVRAGE